MKVLLLILFICSPAFAGEKKVDLSKLGLAADYVPKDPEINFQSRWIHIEGRNYQEIQYKGKNYLVNARKPIGEIDHTRNDVSSEFKCIQGDYRNEAIRNKLAVKIGPFQNVRKHHTFFEFLSNTCKSDMTLALFLKTALNPKIGIRLPEKKADKLKNKKVIYAPANNSLNVSGEF